MYVTGGGAYIIADTVGKNWRCDVSVVIVVVRAREKTAEITSREREIFQRIPGAQKEESRVGAVHSGVCQLQERLKHGHLPVAGIDSDVVDQVMQMRHAEKQRRQKDKGGEGPSR